MFSGHQCPRGHERSFVICYLRCTSSIFVLSCSYFLSIRYHIPYDLWYWRIFNSLDGIAVYKAICNFVCTKFGWAEGGTEGFVRPNRYFINVAGQLQKAATSPLSSLVIPTTVVIGTVLCVTEHRIPFVMSHENSWNKVAFSQTCPAQNRVIMSSYPTMPSRLWWTSTLPVPYPSPARFEGESLGFGSKLKHDSIFMFIICWINLYTLKLHFIFANYKIYVCLFFLCMCLSTFFCPVKFGMLFIPAMDRDKAQCHLTASGIWEFVIPESVRPQRSKIFKKSKIRRMEHDARFDTKFPQILLMVSQTIMRLIRTFSGCNWDFWKASTYIRFYIIDSRYSLRESISLQKALEQWRTLGRFI